MKVYKFYLKMTYKEMSDFKYRLSIETEFQYNPDNDEVLILYGWTDDKILANEFQSIRTKEFIMSKSTGLNDDTFHKFRVEFKEQKIERRKLKMYNNDDKKFEDIYLPITLSEYLAVTSFSEEIISHFIQDICSVPYIPFKTSIQYALDILLYTYYHDVFYAEDESIEDLCSYNRGYGLTPLGQSFYTIRDNIDEYRIFLLNFNELLR